MCHTNNMPKKIVIKVQMNCQKCRIKALKIASETDGVNSIVIQGTDKDELVVTGDGIDSAALTCALRKKVGYAIIVTVQDEKAKKEEKKPETSAAIIPSICYCPPAYVCEPNPSPCSVL